MSDMQEEIKKISDIIPKFIEHDYIHVPYVQDISIFIKHYVEKYKEIFESKQMKIEYELEPLMLNISDRDLERLIEHLTFNAFYYSKQQSTLKMTVRRTECKLEVQDEGIGMTQETIEKILEGPYRTQEAMLMNEKGSGIGFQNIKEVVSKLRGRMQIESIIGQGTKISIFFDEKLIA
jgi:signal transduction histidine kinase